MAELRCSDGTVVKISEETEAELRRQFGPKEPEFGDIVTCCYGRRVVLRFKGRLWAYNKKGDPCGSITDMYTSTGKNIFKDNLLNLSD